jgi:tetratricopeptide (TPR) repeat protein
MFWQKFEFREGDYRQAFSLLQQAVTARPDYLPSHRGLAQIYRHSGKLADALKEFQFILDHSPDDIDALLNLGVLQSTAEEARGCRGHSQQGSGAAAQSRRRYGGVGFAQGGDAHDLPAAEGYLKLAVDKNPRSVPAHLTLIKFYITTGRAAEAEPLFSRALRMSNNNITVLEAQAGYYEGLKKYTEAEAVAKTEASRASDPKYWGALADFYARIGDWARAKSELERVSEQHKNDPGILHKLIEVHLNLNDRKAAEALNEDLLKKNPKDSYGHLFKGRLYLAAGNV